MTIPRSSDRSDARGSPPLGFIGSTGKILKANNNDLLQQEVDGEEYKE